MPKIEIRLAYDEIEVIRELFCEYRLTFDYNLCFENYEREINNLPDRYILPDGRLYLAYVDNKTAGCVGLRRFDQNSSELKRLYLRPEFRGIGLGYQLAKKVVEDSVAEGYQFILLDSLPSMTAAHKIYQSLGFITIEAYYDSNIKDTYYMRCDLRKFAHNYNKTV